MCSPNSPSHPETQFQICMMDQIARDVCYLIYNQKKGKQNFTFGDIQKNNGSGMTRRTPLY
jgi:hypothetical protein